MEERTPIEEAALALIDAANTLLDLKMEVRRARQEAMQALRHLDNLGEIDLEALEAERVPNRRLKANKSLLDD